MKPLFTLAVLGGLSISVFAQAGKSCDDLKAEIAKKIEANGVKTYTLDVVPADKADSMTDAKVVGTCGGGSKKIVYSRKASSDQKPAADEQPKQ
jgi:hypothetical protein